MTVEYTAEVQLVQIALAYNDGQVAGHSNSRI